MSLQMDMALLILNPANSHRSTYNVIMFGIEIIEVAIGLVFSYLTLSTICSGFVQAGIKVTSYRSKHLKLSLGKLLADPTYTRIVDKLYDHHLINGGTLNKLKKTDYINSVDFATALVDCFIEASPTSEKFKAIRQALLELPDDKLRKPLLKMLDESMEDVTIFKAKLADWFDKNMELATNWYRRNMRRFVTIAAFGVVFSMNADTLTLATELWNDDDLRATTVTAAEGYLQTKNEADLINLRALSAVDSNGKMIDSAGYAKAQAELDTVSIRNLVTAIKADVDQANKLPIGWTKDCDKIHELWKKTTPWTTFTWWWLCKFFGLMMTVGAVNLGAPYWFAQLKSLMNLRFNMMGTNNSGSATIPPTPPPAPEPPPAPIVNVGSVTVTTPSAEEETPDTNIV
jgi:hypothetical protein